MTDQAPKTLTLSEFAERALQGEEVKQKMNDGTEVSVRVFTPGQQALMEVQKLWMRVVKLADSPTPVDDIDGDDATLAYAVGVASLAACVRDEGGEPVPEQVIVNLFANLPYKADLMTKCLDMCGVPSELFSVPPLSGNAAIKVLRDEVERAAAEAKPNRKARRAAKKGK